MEAVNIGMYSSNWVNMSVKEKKLLLLAMRMNNAIHIQIRASPKKLINLQLFANVINNFSNL